MKYKNKPIVVEAFRIGYEEAPQWFVDSDYCIPCWDAIIEGVSTIQPKHAEIHTLEGVMKADEGDYVIKGLEGEIYPCKATIFNNTYDKEI